MMYVKIYQPDDPRPDDGSEGKPHTVYGGVEKVEFLEPHPGVRFARLIMAGTAEIRIALHNSNAYVVDGDSGAVISQFGPSAEYMLTDAVGRVAVLQADADGTMPESPLEGPVLCGRPAPDENDVDDYPAATIKQRTD